jgi:hypothetical protein
MFGKFIIAYPSLGFCSIPLPLLIERGVPAFDTIRVGCDLNVLKGRWRIALNDVVDLSLCDLLFCKLDS